MDDKHLREPKGLLSDDVVILPPILCFGRAEANAAISAFLSEAQCVFLVGQMCG